MTDIPYGEQMNKEKAEKTLSKAIKEGGHLYNIYWYLDWEVGDHSASLDGRFTPEQLEAIAWWMRNKGVKP